MRDPHKTALFLHRRHALESSVTSTKPRTFEECNRAVVPVADVLSRIGTKWTIYVIMALSHSPMRFSEIKRHVEGISQKMLTQTLRDLEEDGLVTRKVTPIIPPRVDYELTEMGVELRAPLAAIAQWTRRNGPAIAQSRARYAANRDAA
jgi:DNA-binding HxlR family transcriptional regulator